MKENRRPTSTTATSDSDDHDDDGRSSTSSLHNKRHYETGSSESFQRQPSSSTDADSVKRKSPSIFSSVEELARGSAATQPAPIISLPSFISGHVTSTPVTEAQRSPIMLDLSSDTGYGDSAVCEVTSSCDVTFGLDRTPKVISIPTDDVIRTPLKMADFRLTALNPVATSASVLRQQSISVSGLGSFVAGASETRRNEILHPGGDISAVMSVAMKTASSPEQQQQQQDSLQLIHGKLCHIMPEKNPPLTDGKSCGENNDKVELIHGGFGLKNPFLTCDSDPHNGMPINSQVNSENFGK